MFADSLFTLVAFAVGFGVGGLCNCPMVFGLMFKLSGYQSLKQSLQLEQKLPLQSLIMPASVLASLLLVYIWIGMGPAAAILAGFLSGNVVSFFKLAQEQHPS